jgi:ferredoxin-nitrite reductase
MLGGITGHQDFARATGVIVPPAEATQVADAIVRVFSDHGDRTDRNKARLKYVLDRFGIDTYLDLVEQKLGRKLARVPAEALAPRPAFDRAAHIGVHPQRQEGRHWIGVVLPVGKLTAEQMRGLANVARTFGDGDIRLTVWQNLIISGVATEHVATVQTAIATLGLSTSATSIRAGLVACTGSAGCRFAAADTKRHAEDIARRCEARVALDTPVNIHLTGCHHSCAQHYIGDVGLIACKVPVNDDGDTVEGYHVHVGGGFGPDAAIARELYRDVRAEDAPAVVARMLQSYVAHRAAPDETFLAFARRHDIDALRTMADAEAAA